VPTVKEYGVGSAHRGSGLLAGKTVAVFGLTSKIPGWTRRQNPHPVVLLFFCNRHVTECGLPDGLHCQISANALRRNSGTGSAAIAQLNWSSSRSAHDFCKNLISKVFRAR
jgi:hypothetical protein